MIEHTSVQYAPHGEKQEHLLRLQEQRPGFMDIDAGGITCQSKAGDSQREHHSSQRPLIHTLNEVPTCVTQRAISVHLALLSSDREREKCELHVRGRGCVGKTGREGKNEAGETSAGGGADIHQYPLLSRLNAGVWIKHCLLPFPAGPLEKRGRKLQ